MTQEDKELLLKYLCMALPYGVKILHEGWNYEWDDELSTVERVVGIDDKFIYTKVINTHNDEEYREDSYSIDLFDDKPYLRPMSSMTEEEKEEFEQLDMECDKMPTFDYVPIEYYRIFDWLNARHFDYRGLIEKGLALEASKEMYK